jgi:ribosome-associated protein
VIAHDRGWSLDSAWLFGGRARPSHHDVMTSRLGLGCMGMSDLSGPADRRVGAPYDRGIREIHARDGVIRLGQLLKLADLVSSGGEAKALLETGGVAVNGEPETRRGRQLHPGDVVTVGDDAVQVA